MPNDAVYEPVLELGPDADAGAMLQHISQRLGLTEPLPVRNTSDDTETEDGSRQMNLDDLESFTLAVLRFHRHIPEASNEVGDGWENLRRVHPQRRTELEGLRKEDRLSRAGYHHLIAIALGFPFSRDDDFQDNGFLQRSFLTAVLKSLPEPNINKGLTWASQADEWEASSLARDSGTVALIELARQLRDHEITKPPFQRRNDMWSDTQRAKLIDSMIRSIPLPGIVLGKVERQGREDSHGWLLIDGLQRLTTAKQFFFEDAAMFPAKPNAQTWSTAKEVATKAGNERLIQRVETYDIAVERITAKSETQLAELYERYNASQSRMSTGQIRLAAHHHQSALHHLILAYSGGNDLAEDELAREKLELRTINSWSDRAGPVIAKLPSGRRGGNPNHYEIKDDWRVAFSKDVEKIYDLMCRIVGYNMFHTTKDRTGRLVSNDKKPTTEEAIRAVLGDNTASLHAEDVMAALDRALRHVNELHSTTRTRQDSKPAFSMLKKRTHGDLTRMKIPCPECATATWQKPPKRGGDLVCENGHTLNQGIWSDEGWMSAGIINGWMSQIQTAGVWNLTEPQIQALRSTEGKERLHALWGEFFVDHIVEQRQNTMTLWGKQDIWVNMVHILVGGLMGSKSVAPPRGISNQRDLLLTVERLVPTGLPLEELRNILQVTHQPDEIDYILDQVAIHRASQ